jgi:hypothetical protein
MMWTSRFRKAICAIAAVLAALLVEDSPEGLFVRGSLTSEAEARVGRPLTPLSYAGVARRTTRRVVRRSTIYLATLPRGCPLIEPGLYFCGGTYYQPHNGQFVVVYVD